MIMIKKRIFLVSIIIISLCLVGCDKESDIIDIDTIIGTWTSSDKSDTLDFTDTDNFYRSSLTMQYDHYNCSFDKDSIEIQYQGKLYILIQPTNHKYYLEDNILTIDFSNNNCYGFASELKDFIKE